MHELDIPAPRAAPEEGSDLKGLVADVLGLTSLTRTPVPGHSRGSAA